MSSWPHLINVSRDKDNILDHIYKEQICPDFYVDDVIFIFITLSIRKCILTLNHHFYELFLIESCISLIKYAFSSITLKTLNLHDKSPNTFSLYIFGLKCCPHP